jgi:hypothetical protein
MVFAWLPALRLFVPTREQHRAAGDRDAWADSASAGVTIITTGASPPASNAFALVGESSGNRI